MRMILAIIAMLLITHFAFAAEKLPGEWRYPTIDDMTGGWKKFNEKISVPYHIEHDFNGDDKPDHIWILIAKNEAKCGLFALMSQPQSGYRFIPIQKDIPYPPQDHGISLIKPNQEYRTACDKGFYECNPLEAAKLRVGFFAFEYFSTTGYSRIYHWDVTYGEFKFDVLED